MKNALGDTDTLVRIALVLVIALLAAELVETLFEFAFGLFSPLIILLKPLVTLAVVGLAVTWLWKRL